VKIQDLVTQASAAAIDAVGAAARAARWKAAAVAEAERIRLEVGSADRFGSDQKLGVLRLDGADRPAVPIVTKPAELAGWLAERDPGQVSATITVPADRLEAALEAIGFAGIPDVRADVTPRSGVVEWLRDNCVIHGDPDAPGRWNVLYPDPAGATDVVPGTDAVQPQPRWVLTPAAEHRKDAEAKAVADVEGELVGDATVWAALAEPEDGALDTLNVSELRRRCRSAGLPASGTKAELITRIGTALNSGAAA
jgi:hypothetical protein